MDTTGAGQGDLEVRVVCNGVLVPNRHVQLGDNLYRFIFIPSQAANHAIDIAFNLEKIPGGAPQRTVWWMEAGRRGKKKMLTAEFR